MECCCRGHAMAVATVDTATCGLCLVLALFVRLRFLDSVVAGATDGAVGVGLCWGLIGF